MEQNSNKGMTLHQIRQRKVIVELKREIAKDKISNDLHQLRERFSFKGKEKVGPLANVLAAGSQYLPYFTMGVAALNGVKKITGLFRKKKR